MSIPDKGMTYWFSLSVLQNFQKVGLTGAPLLEDVAGEEGVIFFREVAVLHIKLNSQIFKGICSGLRQLLATECPLKDMKDTFYFT